MENSRFQTIDEYIAACPADIQPKLQELRRIIKNASQELTERMSWQMPTFYLNGNIIHFASNKKHIGIYPGVEAVVSFADRLQDYKTSKGAIQIPNEKPFDVELITDIVKFNVMRKKNNEPVL